MKRIITSIAIGLVAICLAGCVTGCTTVAPSTQNLITGAAAFGTAADLSQRPKDLPYFVATEQELYALASDTNTLSMTDVQAVLISTGGQGNTLEALGLTEALNYGNKFIVANEGTNSLATQEVCGDIADGIHSVVTTNMMSMHLNYHKK